MALAAFRSSGGGPSHLSLAISSCCAAAGVSYCGQRGKATSTPGHEAAHLGKGIGIGMGIGMGSP